MSWDIFIQDLPSGIGDVSEIPHDFRPAPLGPRAEILAKLQGLHPAFAADASGFGRIEFDGVSIEVDVGNEDPTESVALFVRGGAESVQAVAGIVRALGGRALDTGSETGLFDERVALESFQSWADYRDQVVAQQAPRGRPWWRRLLGG